MGRAANGLIDIGALDEFPDESVRVVMVENREIGVVRWHGEVYALHNRCPHMAGPLCLGGVGPRLDGQPGVVDTEDTPVIACPWHHWEFDVRSGRSLVGEQLRVRTYPITINRGRVLIQLGHRTS